MSIKIWKHWELWKYYVSAIKLLIYIAFMQSFRIQLTTFNYIFCFYVYNETFLIIGQFSRNGPGNKQRIALLRNDTMYYQTYSFKNSIVTRNCHCHYTDHQLMWYYFGTNSWKKYNEYQHLEIITCNTKMELFNANTS